MGRPATADGVSPGLRTFARRLRDLPDRAVRSPRAGAFAVAGLALAVAAYAATALYLTRGVTFTFDELTWLVESSRGFDAESVLAPHNGHLIAITRLLFLSSLELFGPEHLPIRVFTIVMVATVAVLAFLLIRRRVGPLPALLGAILILFLGSTPIALQPSVTVFAQSTAAGLAAFLMLERRDRLGDVAACALLVLGVASFSLGVAFVVGAAVMIGLDRDRLRRAWVVVVPLVLFAAWWLWARKFEQDPATISNLLQAPRFAVDSLATALAALAGLGGDLVEGTEGSTAPAWGQILALATLVTLVAHGLRSGLTRLTWVLIAVLVTYWTLGALGLAELRTPETTRYIFPTAVLALVIAAELLRSVDRRRVLAGAAVLVAFALPANLYELREEGAVMRASSVDAAATFAILELQRETVDPGFDGSLGLLIPLNAGRYLELVDRYGPVGTPLDELASGPERGREQADGTLERIVQPSLEPVDRAAVRGPCVTSADRAVLPPEGAVVSSAEGGVLRLGRFAGEATIDVAGVLAAGRPAELRLPPDASPQPWFAVVDGGGAIEVCALGRPS